MLSNVKPQDGRSLFLQTWVSVFSWASPWFSALLYSLLCLVHVWVNPVSEAQQSNQGLLFPVLVRFRLDHSLGSGQRERETCLHTGRGLLACSDLENRKGLSLDRWIIIDDSLNSHCISAGSGQNYDSPAQRVCQNEFVYGCRHMHSHVENKGWKKFWQIDMDFNEMAWGEMCISTCRSIFWLFIISWPSTSTATSHQRNQIIWSTVAVT